MADLNWETFIDWEAEAVNAAIAEGDGVPTRTTAEVHARWQQVRRKTEYATAVETVEESFEIVNKYEENLYGLPDSEPASREEALQGLRKREGTLEALNEIYGILYTNLQRLQQEQAEKDDHGGFLASHGRDGIQMFI